MEIRPLTLIAYLFTFLMVGSVTHVLAQDYQDYEVPYVSCEVKAASSESSMDGVISFSYGGGAGGPYRIVVFNENGSYYEEFDKEEAGEMTIKNLPPQFYDVRVYDNQFVDGVCFPTIGVEEKEETPPTKPDEPTIPKNPQEPTQPEEPTTCEDIRMKSYPKFIEESSRDAYDGMIEITVEGGMGSMMYEWTGPNGYTSYEKDATEMTAGRYTVKVTDERGCVAYFTYYMRTAVDEGVEEEVACDMTVRVKHSDETKAGAKDGFIHVEINGGEAPYQVTWMGPDDYYTTEESSSKSQASGLKKGQYYLYIEDANGCENSFSYYIYQGEAAEENLCDKVDIFLTEITTGNIMDGYRDKGDIYVKAIGGTGPYQYYWKGPNGYEAEGEFIDNLSQGVYQVTVVDYNGCSYAEEILVANYSCNYADLEIKVKKPSSIDAADGELEILGSEENQYLWIYDNGSQFAEGTKVTGVPVGEVWVEIIYPNSCVQEQSLYLDYEAAEARFTTYPNPSNGVFNLKFPATVNKAIPVEVLDLSGKVVATISLEGYNIQQVSLESLEKGIYMIKRADGDRIETERIIIK
ncbi:T9SS type A sorting domain-containing protein [Algivirga pacifica]|uniref:Secretion system C-terminal sorting domain-containing protein n=1 Tax=Algivirga pacifica TaxID=1162670 RepID=A0ABP9DA73_9BACT